MKNKGKSKGRAKKAAPTPTPVLYNKTDLVSPRLRGTDTPDRPDDSWYTSGGMEPWIYIEANRMGFFEGSAIKYLTRWRKKNGLEDLQKARVYVDELIRQESARLARTAKVKA